MLSHDALPAIQQSRLDIQPVDTTGLPDRFMWPGELEVIAALMRSVNPRTVIEFGVNEGRTAAVMLRTLPAITRYIGVDVPFGYVPTCAVQRNEVPRLPGRFAKHDPRFDLIIRPQGSRELTPSELPRADVVFVDGDHSTGGVTCDAELARRVINPGGVVIYHDYHFNGTVGVADVLHDLRARGRDLHHVENTWLAFERF